MEKLLVIGLISASLVLGGCFKQETTPDVQKQVQENIQSWVAQQDRELPQIFSGSSYNNSFETKQIDSTDEESPKELSIFDLSNPKIDSKSLSEYREMLIKLWDKTSSGRTNLYDRASSDTQILQSQLPLLANLFKQGLLPSLKTFTMDNKEYVITVAFVPWSGVSPPLEQYWGEKANCGLVSVPGWEYDGPCIYIRKDDNKAFIPEKMMPLKNWSWEPAFQVVRGKYLLTKSSDGDSCGASTSYALFDSEFKSVSHIEIAYNGCDGGMTTTFIKWDSAVSFYNPPKENSGNPPESKEIIGSEQGVFSTLSFLKTATGASYVSKYMNARNFLYLSDSRFRMDMEKNLLNGDVFSFTINAKEVNYNPTTELKWSTSDMENLSLSMKKITDGYEISAATFWSDWSKSDSLVSATIRSCKDNGDSYDPEPFSPKSLNLEKGTLTYRISKKFGNACQIPYEFTSTRKGDNTSITQKVEILFPE